ncbi:sugar ABC transporter permease [Nocardioides rotundus]|uniref:carbohydrate ABC transporter permease n=1 Tax=Nocardioides rotundus TaxID=1774216 RepID=UPI001CBD6DD9|nr:sugar ABC transporter permease [Nocardioides rotundus]UAL30170.1 sugar ABC transporter permease [Nocardioides rotundus]
MSAGRGTATRGAPGEPRAVAYLYLAPALLVWALFMAWPLIRAVWLSFYEWDGLSVGTWVGLDNYVAVFTDPELREPFGHALVLLFFFSVLPILFGLVLASITARADVRGAGFFRTVIFLPQVVAMVVVAIAWRQIYEPSGPLNDGLRALGLDGLTHAWLGEQATALAAVGLVGTWVGTGLCMVLFLAGLSKVPRELYEAAALDGAGALRQLWHVGLPALRGEIAVAITLTVVAALRTFDLVYVMTTGGPGTATRVPAYEVWRWSLNEGRVGYGVTIALVLTALILLVTVVVNQVAERGER